MGMIYSSRYNVIQRKRKASILKGMPTWDGEACFAVIPSHVLDPIGGFVHRTRGIFA